VKVLDNLITRGLDEGLVVARPGGHRLFVMNASARFIWEQRARGTDDTQIPRLMVDYYGIDIKQAESDFRKTLERWRLDGLTAPIGPRRFYEIGDAGFSVEYANSDIEAIVAPILGHLQSETPQSPRDNYEREYAIDAQNGQFILRTDGIEMVTSHALDGVVERLLLDCVMYAYKKVDWLVSTHAAAVGTDHGCILMPGASGAGKSTLTASLLARPHIRYLADDIVLLDRENLYAVPLPGTLVLKSGSWNVLESLLQGLASRTIHRRNNENVKYWAPSPGQVARNPLPVKAVVFPQRGDRGEPPLTPLSPLEGLSRIITAPATISPPITSAVIDGLMEWARGIPFYVFAHGRLEDAAGPIEALLSQ
jgi:hypothetical protein